MLFSFPSRYSFTIGQGVVFSLRRWSAQIPAGFHVSRGTRGRSPGRPFPFAYGALTLYGVGIPPTSARERFCNSPRGLGPPPATPHYPVPTNAPRLLRWERFRLFPFRSPLLRESMSLSFPPGTEMFHFPGFASYGYSGKTLPHTMTRLIGGPGFPIRASRDHRLYAPPPGFSQLNTPFIASPCRAIHLWPLVISSPHSSTPLPTYHS